jgi:hypothetical protein
MKTNLSLDQLVEVAKEVEVGDPFDWADVSVDEDEAYKLMAMNLLTLDMDYDIMLATIVKLSVENMVLNLRLMKNGVRS